MTFLEYTEKKYREHLKLAREEDPNISASKAHYLAAEWTQEDVAQLVERHLDQKYWRCQDMVNKEFWG